MEEAARRVEESRRLHSGVLDLSKLDLKAVPESMTQLGELDTLDLSHNQLTAVPDVLAQLAGLQSLYLYGNQVAAISDSLARATLRRQASEH
jgi:Leucine-rich repeat (LRR) protein